MATQWLVLSPMKKAVTYPRRAQDAYVSQRMLFKVRDELKEQIAGSEARLRSDIHAVRSEMHEMKSDVHELKADVHRIALLVEEQNNRNKIVLDGLAHTIGRQDRIENEWDELKRKKRREFQTLFFLTIS